jgi:NitT/TauT family transport system substrate-binding protein
MKRFFPAFAAGILVTLGAASAASAADTVQVGAVNSVSDAPFLIADKKGFFAEQGIKVEFTTFASAALMVQPLASGQLDVGGGAPSAGLYNALSRGLGLHVVADRGRDTPGYGYAPLLVRQDLITSGKFKTLKDLKGMKMAEPAKGTTIMPAVDALMTKAGLKYDDVEHVFIAFPDQVAALRTGAIDATVTLEPWGTLAQREGYAKIIAGDDEFYPNQELAVVLYADDFAKKRPDVARRFMIAYVKAVRFYNDALKNGKMAGTTANDVVSILEEVQKAKPEILRAMTPAGIDPNGRVNVQSLENDYKVYKRLGVLTGGDYDVSKAVDMSYVDAAVKALGPYKRK